MIQSQGQRSKKLTLCRISFHSFPTWLKYALITVTELGWSTAIEGARRVVSTEAESSLITGVPTWIRAVPTG